MTDRSPNRPDIYASKTPSRRTRLFAEPLEDRLTPAAFVVDRIGDTGAGPG